MISWEFPLDKVNGIFKSTSWSLLGPCWENNGKSPAKMFFFFFSKLVGSNTGKEREPWGKMGRHSASWKWPSRWVGLLQSQLLWQLMLLLTRLAPEIYRVLRAPREVGDGWLSSSMLCLFLFFPIPIGFLISFSWPNLKGEEKEGNITPFLSWDTG